MAANWDTGSVPTNTDDVVVALDGDYTITHNLTVNISTSDIDTVPNTRYPPQSLTYDLLAAPTGSNRASSVYEFYRLSLS